MQKEIWRQNGSERLMQEPGSFWKPKIRMREIF